MDNNEHICDESCMEETYEGDHGHRVAMLKARREWDKIAPGIYEEYRKWLDEEDGCDEEVELTIKLTLTMVRCIDLKRIEMLYYQFNKVKAHEIDSELVNICLDRNEFIYHIINDYLNDEKYMSREDDKDADASDRECNLVLKQYNRIKNGPVCPRNLTCYGPDEL